MVEWKKLSEICDIFAGGDLPKNYIKASEPSGKYIYPIYSNGVEEKSLYGYSDTFRVDKASITISARGTIGYHTIREPQFTPIVRLITLIPKNNEIVNLEYLNEALFFFFFYGTKGGIPQLTVPAVSQIKIPILSLSEQQRIVDILDTFTSSIENLKEQIAQRRKQYEYYRDQLLDLEGKEGVEMKISDFCLLKAGKSISADDIFEKRIGYEYPCIGGNGIRGYVSLYSHEGSYPVIGRQGALCGCVNWITGKFYATEHAVVATGKENMDQRFLFYLFENADLNQYKTQGAQPGLSVAKLNEVSFIIPSLSEQHRIVSILDTFEASIQNLEVQLSQREKQYEYYRNKLLTFEE